MQYILLLIGLLALLYALYRFFLSANVRQIKALFLTGAICAVVGGMFYMAVTGRLPAAIALAAALIPIVVSVLRDRKAGQAGKAESTIGSREEALEILGLSEGASIEDIKAAYKKLMKKVHPDQEGSEWMAAKLNAAKDLLLDQKP